MTHFVGSKGGAGVHQWLINLMAPHRVYCECFLGRGVILRTKRPAELNIGIEADPKVFSDYAGRRSQSETLILGDCLSMLPALKMDSTWLVYADPPYLGSVRSCKRTYYRNELFSAESHKRLLAILTSLQANVIISGYQSELYSMLLKDWRVSSFWTVNRRGKRVQEFAWMNFAPPARLHDARFAGNDFTDRQRIARKVERWKNDFATMPVHEQSAIMEGLRSTIVEPGCERSHIAARDPIADSDCSGRNSYGIPQSQPQLFGSDSQP